ncbi:UNVERIFIED_CONTAM: organic solute transporter ostalpha protein [Hammondia hammondi]|eukprot:XP_008887956.1 organic solute transporter ostalpha protein [Hammondia hammondi]
MVLPPFPQSFLPPHASPRLSCRSAHETNSQESVSNSHAQFFGSLSACLVREKFKTMPNAPLGSPAPEPARHTSAGEASSASGLTLPLLRSTLDNRVPSCSAPWSPSPASPPTRSTWNGEPVEFSLTPASPCKSATPLLSCVVAPSTPPSTAPSPVSDDRSSTQSLYSLTLSASTGIRGGFEKSRRSRQRKANEPCLCHRRSCPPRLAASISPDCRALLSESKPSVVSSTVTPRLLSIPSFASFSRTSHLANARECGPSSPSGDGFPSAFSSSLCSAKLCAPPHFRLFAASSSARGFFTLPALVQPPASWRQRRQSAFLALLVFLFCLFLFFGVLLPHARVEQLRQVVPTSRKGTGALSRNVDIDEIALPEETRGSHVVAVGGIKPGDSYTRAQRDSPVRGEVDGRREASEAPSFSANQHPADSARTTSPSADDQGNMAHGISSPVLATSPQSRESIESSSSLDPPRSDGRVLADSLSVSRLPLALSSLFSLPPVFLFLLFVSIGCCLACITISSTLVYKHLTNYYEPHLQRYVCRICLVGPAFALASLIYFAHTLLSISPESDPTLSATSLESSFAFSSAAPPAAATSLAAVGGEAGEALARSRRLPLNAAVPFKDSLSTLLAGSDEPASSGARLEEVFIDFLRDLAQAVALYSFLVLMINCCGEETGVWDLYFREDDQAVPVSALPWKTPNSHFSQDT